MNLKIHKKGSSFTGLVAKYLMHDAGHATTSDRVAWTQTINLATDDPTIAAYLMAATAQDAPRLKAQAGVKNTGRKSDKSVLHVTLSWHPDESKDLVPEEMMRAARFAIKHLGAEDRQAVVVCHNDKEHPHIHLVINRISMTDGRMLSSSFEKMKLSEFGQRYEKERGKIYCPNRVINNAARKRGEFTRAEKDIPRPVFEQIRSNDNTIPRDEVKKIWQRHRAKDQEIGRRHRATKSSLAAGWAKLQSDYQGRKAEIHEQMVRDVRQAIQRVIEQYRPAWEQRHRDKEQAYETFKQNERGIVGRIKNTAKSIDLKAIILGDQKARALGDVFGAMGSEGVRLELHKKEQERLDDRLEAKQNRDRLKATAPFRQIAREQVRQAGMRYSTERADLVFRQSMERAKMKADWAERVPNRRFEFTASMNDNVKKSKADAMHERLKKARNRKRDQGRGRGP